MSIMMRISITVDIHPFQVPDHVCIIKPAKPRQVGFGTAETIPLNELDADTLQTLVEEFRVSVYEKAGIPLPATPV